ncbi:Ran GTPase, partial [Tanacetum coccineum]
MSSSSAAAQYDMAFKILLIGDSGVGKSSLLLSLVSNSLEDVDNQPLPHPRTHVLKHQSKRQDGFQCFVILIGRKLNTTGIAFTFIEAYVLWKEGSAMEFIDPSLDDTSSTYKLIRCMHVGLLCVDFKIKQLTVGGKKLKLTIWDTAGQERFRTLTSSYYRGAQGIILAYDVTRRNTFISLSNIWAKEVERYSTNQDCVRMLVGNKVDKDSERFVSKEEGIALAKELGCLFFECSATTLENVHQCFEELALKIMEVPSLVEESANDTYA